jgi:hypothetical protein
VDSRLLIHLRGGPYELNHERFEPKHWRCWPACNHEIICAYMGTRSSWAKQEFYSPNRQHKISFLHAWLASKTRSSENCTNADHKKMANDCTKVTPANLRLDIQTPKLSSSTHSIHNYLLLNLFKTNTQHNHSTTSLVNWSCNTMEPAGDRAVPCRRLPCLPARASQLATST